MKNILITLMITMLYTGCNPSESRQPDGHKQKVSNRQEHNNWSKRTVDIQSVPNLIKGNTYLPVYSEIYARKESRTYPLTITVSIRNTSVSDSIYVNKSEYYNTHGELINTYFDQTIYVAPMETVEIVVEEDHKQGGSGGNFVFHWATQNPDTKPLFQAIMISASGQQGISFITQGVDLDNY